MVVGSLVQLKVDCLGNPKGTIGICYESYCLGGTHQGSSVIFPNGNYDGFSEEEQKDFLQVIGFDKSMSSYEFTNVIKLSQDFRDSYFAKAFNENIPS